LSFSQTNVLKGNKL